MNFSRQPRVFISRTTAGLKALGDQIVEILRQRKIEPIVQTDFYPSTHDVKGMLAEHLQQCDAVICLIGSAYGSWPKNPKSKAEQPVYGLKDPRTKNRIFSYTQLELLIARDLGRPVYTFFIEGDELTTSFAPEPLNLAQRQQTFINEFAKDGENTYRMFDQWDDQNNPAHGLKQVIEAVKFEISILAEKPANLPYHSLGTLFKGRDKFLTDLRQHLVAEGPVVIKGKRTIHGMGGVGKTRAVIEYAWKNSNEYQALLFISADTPKALYRSLASLCSPLVLNLPQQNEQEQALQVEAVLRWLKLNSGWLLIIDNVDTDEAVEETKALLAKLTTGHVVITSRISDWTGHAKSLDLNVLTEAASIAFLDERTYERRPKQDNDRQKVIDLVRLLDCLALALEQAGAHISSNSISYAEYIDLWQFHRSDALAWHDEPKMKYPRSLAITYETSVAQLSKGAKVLFRTMAWFAPDPIPRRLLDYKSDPANEKRYVGELERLHLARYITDGKSFVIHRLIQEITRQQQSIFDPAESLIAAMQWIEEALEGAPSEIYFWLKATPVAQHGETILSFLNNCKNSEALGRLHRKIGLWKSSIGIYEEAITYGRTACSILCECLGGESPDYLSCRNDLAVDLDYSGAHLEAESEHRWILKKRSSLLGSKHPLTLKSMSNLAETLREQQKLSEAEELIKEGIKIEKRVLGQEHPDYLTSRSNLAVVYHQQGKFPEAETEHREVLELRLRVLGEEHPDTLASFINLAGTLDENAEVALRSRNKLGACKILKEAVSLATRAEEIGKLVLNEDHPWQMEHEQEVQRLTEKLNQTLGQKLDGDSG